MLRVTNPLLIKNLTGAVVPYGTCMLSVHAQRGLLASNIYTYRAAGCNVLLDIHAAADVSRFSILTTKLGHVSSSKLTASDPAIQAIPRDGEILDLRFEHSWHEQGVLETDNVADLYCI